MKITIVTPSYNAIETIERSICSVVNQTYNDIEYIIVDGGSKDGTIDLIKKYEKYITYWISETDCGIYDAMNKGISRASGNYIYFLGTDDWLIDERIITNISQILIEKHNVDIFMGSVLQVDYDLKIKRKFGRDLSTDDIFSGCMNSHQGMFFKKEILKKTPFDINYKIAADFDLLMRCVINGYKIAFEDIVIANFSKGGASSKQRKLYLEYNEIINKYSNIKSQKAFLKRSKYNFVKSIMEYIIPSRTLRVLKLYRGWEEL